jgi:4-amino-4-deoxy-L-arabinose transferase-like glycosyltransferase
VKGRSTLVLFALFTLGLHLVFSGQSYFSDETYFIDLSNHLDSGYLADGPLVPLLVRISRIVFGNSLLGLRVFPALGHAGTVFLAGLIACELGGAAFAQALACLSVLIAPGYLMLGGMVLTPSLEPFFWTLTAYLVLLVLTRARPELWLAAGISLGLGFLNKPTIALFGLALLVGVALSPARRLLLSRWLGLGAIAGLLIALPNILWQIRHPDWNMLVFVRSVRESRLAREAGTGAFFLAPVLALHPFNFPIWLAGLEHLRRNRIYRTFFWAWLLPLGAIWVLGGKPYYLAGAFPILLASGAVVAEHAFARFQTAAIVALGVAGVVLAPAGLPVLSARATSTYLGALGLNALSQTLQLPGVRADMDGVEREKFLQSLAKVYSEIEPRLRPNLVILASHYFETSWINVLGPAYGLPHAVSGNNNYYLWGPGSASGEVTIAVGLEETLLHELFEQVEPSQDSRIHICRHPRLPLAQAWLRLKSFPF